MRAGRCVRGCAACPVPITPPCVCQLSRGGRHSTAHAPTRHTRGHARHPTHTPDTHTHTHTPPDTHPTHTHTHTHTLGGCAATAVFLRRLACSCMHLPRVATACPCPAALRSPGAPCHCVCRRAAAVGRGPPPAAAAGADAAGGGGGGRFWRRATGGLTCVQQEFRRE